jgi:hypothetical protein
VLWCWSHEHGELFEPKVFSSLCEMPFVSLSLFCNKMRFYFSTLAAFQIMGIGNVGTTIQSTKGRLLGHAAPKRKDS